MTDQTKESLLARATLQSFLHASEPHREAIFEMVHGLRNEMVYTGVKMDDGAVALVRDLVADPLGSPALQPSWIDTDATVEPQKNMGKEAIVADTVKAMGFKSASVEFVVQAAIVRQELAEIVAGEFKRLFVKDSPAQPGAAQAAAPAAPRKEFV